MKIDIFGPLKDFSTVCVKIETLKEDYRVLIDLQIERRWPDNETQESHAGIIL
jgi:hypothetical protein